MTEDHELDSWREQWSRVTELSPDFQRSIHQRIRSHNRRFVLGNLLTGIAFIGMLVFAVFMRHQANSLGSGWATGIFLLVVVSVGLRVWFFRGTWRPATYSTRAFVELWHRRVLARIRLLRVSMYLAAGWLVVCAVLFTVNWPIVRPEVKAHPREWLGLLVGCLLMQPVIWFWAAWLLQRKTAESCEVERSLDELRE